MVFKVTIDNTGNATTLTQYPIQISLTASNFDFTGVQADGSDLRVLNSDETTVIPYYIRAIDTGAKTAEIWARVDSIPGSGTKDIFISKGNSTSAFTIPPTGKFTRPTSSIAAGLAENMVYDSGTNKYYIAVSALPDGPVRLYSSSTPGGSWTDEGIILNVGSAGAWDDAVIYAPHLIKDGSTWYLFYTGGPDLAQNSHSIGYATASSITGPYTRYGSNPVLTYSGSATFDQYRAAEPYVFYSDILSQWVMFYMGDSGSGSASQIEKIGYATASAITGPWTKYASNPVISYSANPAWNDTQVIADPFVIEIDGTAYVFCSAGKEGYNTSIGVFTTTDYATFTEIGQVFGTGPEGNFDDTGAIRGAITRVGDTYYLPYAGFDGANFAWAIASMSAVSTASGFDPLQVFDYYDDFPGSSLDADLWSTISGSNSGTATVTGSVLTMAITSGADAHQTRAGHREFGVGYVIEAYIRHSTATSTSTNAGEIGLADESDRNPAARMYHYDSTKVRKESLNNAGASTVADMTQNLSTGWQKWSVAFISSSSMGFRVDANSWETIGTNISDRVLKPWLFAFRGSANVSLEVDWVIVRKYANPEPTYTIVFQVEPSSISSDEAFDVPTVSSDALAVFAVSIDSDEAFGVPELSDSKIYAVSIDSVEAFGVPSLVVTLSPVSIDSAEAFGVPTLWKPATYKPVSKILH